MLNQKLPVRKMNKSTVRVMLDYLGVPLIDQHKRTSVVKEQLEKFQGIDPDSYEKAYDLVVNYKVPEGGEPTQISYIEASKIIKDEIAGLKNLATETIRDEYSTKVSDCMDRMEKLCDNRITEASRVFNKTVLEVKVNGKKTGDLKNEIVPEYFERMIKLATARKNIMLVGPAGAGKTHVSEMLARSLGMDFSSQSCSGGVSETAFTGRLLPLGKSGAFEYVESDFVRIYEQGGVFLFDEMDNGDPNVLAFLNQALANGSFYLAQRIGKTKVSKHKDFIAVGAMNTFGTGADAMYTARNALDAATLDRFRIGMITVDYSATLEEKLIDPEILIWGLLIREKIKNHKLKKIMSTRLLIDATDMLNVGWGIHEIEESYFADWSREEKLVIGRNS